MTRTILVATDGSAGSAGALRMARLLARDGSRVILLAVHNPVNLYPAGYADAIAPIPADQTAAAIESLRGEARTQAERAGLGASELIVEVGSVTPTIARVAAERNAELVVLGQHEGGGFGGWRARETLLRLVHLAHVPVLAVPAETNALPRRVVVGSDFSPFSARAARDVVRQLGPGAEVHLVHVITEFTWAAGGPVMTEWAATYRAGAERRLREVAGDLASSGDVRVQQHLRVGDPAEEILKVADELGAELIAVGSHGTGFIGRIILGSTTARLIHQANRAVLISPPRAIAPELGLELTEGELMGGLGRAGEMVSSEPAGAPGR